jgi:ATP-dependent helicase/nuclease subunit B
MTAAVELPRRLASTGRPLTHVYPFTLPELAKAMAGPLLLEQGLGAWSTGHAALLAARLLDGPHRLRLDASVSRARLALSLGRTLSELRLAGLDPARLQSEAGRTDGTAEDSERLRGVAELYRGFVDLVDGRMADPVAVAEAAARRVRDVGWLEEVELLIVDDLELAPVERDLLAAIARARTVRLVARAQPRGLAPASFSAWAAGNGIERLDGRESLFASLEPDTVPVGLSRLQNSLFEPPDGKTIEDGSVELLTAPGEEAEAREVVRRLLLAAARGVPFEEMGVILPRPTDYAPLFSELLARLGIPFRVHPSLPLSFGRCARSLLLLLRCRGLPRRAVMEFLSFAPIPFQQILGLETEARPWTWDALSRDAGIVSGLERWIIGLRSFAEDERHTATTTDDAERGEARRRRALEAETLLRVVELLSSTLDGLAGEASWSEWSERLVEVLELWVESGEDRGAVVDVALDLARLDGVASETGRKTRWEDVEAVLQARLEWDRLPLRPASGGAVHVGAMEAMAGLPFRVVAIPGLAEGGYPGVLRPDPFLLDPEREALGRDVVEARPTPTRLNVRRGRPVSTGQLSLFDDTQAPPAQGETTVAGPRLPTTQDRLLEARRRFHRALRQATERLILSYPRADPRTGRERMPSLFFVAAATALQGRPVDATALRRLVSEDEPESLALEAALDRSERDLLRVGRGGSEAVVAVAEGSAFFRQSRLASLARWSRELTPYDGLVAYSPHDPQAHELAAPIRRQLDPVTAERPISASRLATFARCGFMYLLRYVLRLEPALEPLERRKLEPLERGTLFHEVAERFLRERRDRGELPVRDTPEMRRRLLEKGDESLEGLVASSPPRYKKLWEWERERFRLGLLAWLRREEVNGGRTTPAHFEVSFGLAGAPGTAEPHSLAPLDIDLGDERRLRVSGVIDRIDRHPDGSLCLRDYKTGRAPKDDGAVFRGGRQLQIPFYILAAAQLFPEQPVVDAFLDYVDGGRRLAVNPATVKGQEFQTLLRGLVDAIGQGIFAQEPSSCGWCDFTAVCGPSALLRARLQRKARDPRLRAVQRLREIG